MSILMKGVFACFAVTMLYAAAACASGPPKTQAQKQADNETAERVESALISDKALYAQHIFVNADDGVVHLSGYVWEPSDFQLALAIAENVPGVTRVLNDLELNRNGNEDSPVAR